MERLHYLAVLERSEIGSFGVFFPDLPGCVTAGASEAEAWTNAEGVLNLHIAGMIEDGDMLPEPTLPSQVPYDPDIEELARMLIPVSGAQPKVRVNVMLDANVLQAIDMVSDNRSQFLTAAAKAQLRLTTSLPAKSKRRRVRSIRAG